MRYSNSHLFNVFSFLEIMQVLINIKKNNQDAIYRVCWNSELHTSYNVNLPVFLYVRTLELKKIKNE